MKKIISMLLVLTLTLSMLTTTMWAEGNAASAESEAVTETVIPENTESETEEVDGAFSEETVIETITATGSYVPEFEENSDELLEEYLYVLNGVYPEADTNAVVNGNTISWPALNAAKSQLPTQTAKDIYNDLAAQLSDIAAHGGSTELTVTFATPLEFTKAELGLSDSDPWSLDGENLNPTAVDSFRNKKVCIKAVTMALLYDMPYQLYWYDKVSGIGYGASYRPDSTLQVEQIVINFTVSSDYMQGTDPYYVDENKADAAVAAANSANTVVTANAAKSDFEKLKAYKDYICANVAYNSAAAKPNYPYGDPFQIIYVFDSDSTTNVVCEGYAKAFKYLCDLTAWSNDVECILVTGTMSGGTGAGSHMWNIVTIGDKNYLVDLTNCDSGTVGAPDKLFLCGATKNTEKQYTANGVTYTYNDDTTASHPGSQLVLSSTKYVPESAPAPTGLTPSNNQTTGRVKLSWNAVAKATGYNIYRATSANGSYEKLASNVTATNYTDGKSGNAGTTYYYKVSAVVGGAETALSAPASRVAMCQRPTGLSATANSDGTVTLTWNEPTVKGSVTGYRIYKWTGSAFEWIGGNLKSNTNSVAIPAEYVTPGVMTQYSVRGFNTKNTLGSISIYAVPASCTVLAGPTGLTPANNLTTGRVKLSWNAVAGATGYNIYRATSANGTYTKINDSAVTTTNYTDGKSGNAGNTYYYKVSAVVGGTETALSTAVSQMSKCQRPAGLSATANSDGTVTLTWDKPAITSSVSYYRVYKWNGTGFEWIGGTLKTAGGSNTTFTIPAEYVTPGAQYSIRGYNTKDILGSMSIYAAAATCTVSK